MKRRKIAANVLIYAILILLAVIWVAPIFFLVIHSFRAEPGATVQYLLPK